jgi:hypothetical protein
MWTTNYDNICGISIFVLWIQVNEHNTDTQTVPTEKTTESLFDHKSYYILWDSLYPCLTGIKRVSAYIVRFWLS